jgi:hypothetical protein
MRMPTGVSVTYSLTKSSHQFTSRLPPKSVPPPRPQPLLPKISICRRQLDSLRLLLHRLWGPAWPRIIMLNNINRPQRPHPALPPPTRCRPRHPHAQQIRRPTTARGRHATHRAPLGGTGVVAVVVGRGGVAQRGVGDKEGLGLVVLRELVRGGAIAGGFVVVVDVDEVDGFFVLVGGEAFAAVEEEEDEGEGYEEDEPADDTADDCPCVVGAVVGSWLVMCWGVGFGRVKGMPT